MPGAFPFISLISLTSIFSYLFPSFFTLAGPSLFHLCYCLLVSDLARRWFTYSALFCRMFWISLALWKRDDTLFFCQKIPGLEIYGCGRGTVGFWS